MESHVFLYKIKLDLSYEILYFGEKESKNY